MKKRTCWPSGSKWASKRVSAIAAAWRRPWNGTVSSSRPPRLSTRRASLSSVADVRDVLEHLRAPDEVELAVAERERAVGLEQPHVGAGHVRSRPLDGRLGDLDPDRVGARVAQRRQEAPGAAAEVQHALARLAPRASSSARRRSHAHGSGSARRVGPERLVEGAHAR